MKLVVAFSILVALSSASAAAQAPADRELITIQSSILGETRRVFVSVPPGFEKSAPSRRYPLMIVTDGEGHSATAAVNAARELARHGLAPDMVIAGIENVGGYDSRVRDLTPPGMSVSGSSRNERGDRFLDFIERELIPMLDARFRTAAPRVLAGHSSGGILATYAAATRDTFRVVVALDTPTHLEEEFLVAKLLARARADGPPVRYASYNAVYGWRDAAWAGLVAAAPSSWVLRHDKFANETHNSMPMLGAYLGLRELFSDYSRKAAPVYPTTSILPYYEKLGAAYGAALVPPQPLMRDVVDDLLMEGRGARAAEAFDAMIAAYGEPANAAETRARIAEVSARPAPTETVESLLATPLATAEEIAPYVGVWEGESRRRAPPHAIHADARREGRPRGRGGRVQVRERRRARAAAAVRHGAGRRDHLRLHERHAPARNADVSDDEERRRHTRGHDAVGRRRTAERSRRHAAARRHHVATRALSYENGILRRGARRSMPPTAAGPSTV